MAIYVNRDEVKAHLRTWSHLHTGGRRIDFSEVYLNLARGMDNSNEDSTPPNPTPLGLYRVDFEDSWQGICVFKTEFSDESTFTAWMLPEGNEQWVDLGSGVTTAPFTGLNPFTTPPSAIFTLEDSYWSGVAQADDLMQWESHAVVSNEYLDEICIDAQAIVNSWLLAHPRRVFARDDYTSLVFPTVAEVPREVRYASKLVACFITWGIVTPVADLEKSQVFQWWQSARNQTNIFVEGVLPRMAQYVTRAPVNPMSANDSLQIPIFGFRDISAQGIEVTIEIVMARLQDYQLDKDLVNYTPPWLPTGYSNPWRIPT